MNYVVKDIEMVPGRRGGICLCVNTVREAMYKYIFQAKKQNQQKKNKPKTKEQISLWNQKGNRRTVRKIRR